jgi:hypothetical protein
MKKLSQFFILVGFKKKFMGFHCCATVTVARMNA